MIYDSICVASRVRFARNKNSHLARSVVVFIFSQLLGLWHPAATNMVNLQKGGVNLRFWRKFSKKYSSFSRWRICIWLLAWELIVQKHNSEKLFCLEMEHEVVSVTWHFIPWVYFMKNFSVFAICTPNRKKNLVTIRKSMLSNRSTDTSLLNINLLRFICNLTLLYRWKLQ